MRWLLFGLAVIAAIALVAVTIGWLLPVGHVASRSASFTASPETVWRAITGVDGFPSWRRDVRKVERLPDREGKTIWVEEGSSGRLTLAIDESDPPRRLVSRIADPALPFGGTWTYDIAPTPGGCTLTITENGEIYNPLFRVMARFVFGYEATMASYLEALATKLSK
jgi:uncharacterized protein YndB with AHSA1/START domain